MSMYNRSKTSSNPRSARFQRALIALTITNAYAYLQSDWGRVGMVKLLPGRSSLLPTYPISTNYSPDPHFSGPQIAESEAFHTNFALLALLNIATLLCCTNLLL